MRKVTVKLFTYRYRFQFPAIPFFSADFQHFAGVGGVVGRPGQEDVKLHFAYQIKLIISAKLAAVLISKLRNNYPITEATVEGEEKGQDEEEEGEIPGRFLEKLSPWVVG